MKENVRTCRMFTVKIIMLFVVVILFVGAHRVKSYAAEETYQFTIGGEVVAIPCDFQEGDTFNMITVNTQYDMEVVLDNIDAFPSITVEIDGVVLEEDALFLSIEEIASSHKVAVTITENEIARTCYLNTLNTNMPQLEFTMNGEGYYSDYFMSFAESRTIVQFNRQGEIIYYRCEDEVQELGTDGLWDFKAHEIYDEDTGTYEVYYSYHSVNQEPTGIYTPGCQPGTRIIMNEHYEVVDMVEAIPTEGNEGVTQLDGHEFIMIELGHYIVEQYVQKTVDLTGIEGPSGVEGVENSVIVGGYIQEIQDGVVVFEWLSTDYEPFYTMTELDGDDTADQYGNTDTSVVVDYFHLNSIAIVPEGMANEGNLLVSARHVNAIMMINRIDDSHEENNDLIWVVEDATSCQHYAQYSSESSTAVNNGIGYISIFNNNDDMTLRGETWTPINTSDTEEVTQMVLFPLDGETGEMLVDSEEVQRITFIETSTEIENYSFSCGSLLYVMEEDKQIATIGWGNNSVGNTYLSEVFLYEDGTKEINFEVSCPEDAQQYMSYRSVGANLERVESTNPMYMLIGISVVALLVIVAVVLYRRKRR